MWCTQPNPDNISWIKHCQHPANDTHIQPIVIGDQWFPQGRPNQLSQCDNSITNHDHGTFRHKQNLGSSTYSTYQYINKIIHSILVCLIRVQTGSERRQHWHTYLFIFDSLFLFNRRDLVVAVQQSSSAGHSPLSSTVYFGNRQQHEWYGIKHNKNSLIFRRNRCKNSWRD